MLSVSNHVVFTKSKTGLNGCEYAGTPIKAPALYARGEVGDPKSASSWSSVPIFPILAAASISHFRVDKPESDLADRGYISQKVSRRDETRPGFVMDDSRNRVPKAIIVYRWLC